MSAVLVPGWTRFAACAGTDPALWFGADDELGQAQQRREAKAIEVCRQCPVRRQCLEHALSKPAQFGIAGGLNEERRRALRHAWVKRQQRQEGRAA